ncbi:hypothetical protein [Adhaeribacter aerolatus]|nr:hypothetical protein [Adhaeribacter aerolatus]
MDTFLRKYWLGILIIFNLGCQLDYVEPLLIQGQAGEADARKKPATDCSEYFYFYEQTRVMLGEVNTSKIVLGFREGVTSEQKAAFIAKHPYLQSIQNELNTGSADATIVLLTTGLTCAQVETVLNQLAKKQEIRYANPFFQSPIDESLLGITNQFILNLKPGYTSEDLEKLTRRTKTRIVEQLGEGIFILSADKYSAGNALQMANKFSQFRQVASSEPDFLYDLQSPGLKL